MQLSFQRNLAQMCYRKAKYNKISILSSKMYTRLDSSFYIAEKASAFIYSNMRLMWMAENAMINSS